MASSEYRIRHYYIPDLSRARAHLSKNGEEYYYANNKCYRGTNDGRYAIGHFAAEKSRTDKYGRHARIALYQAAEKVFYFVIPRRSEESLFDLSPMKERFLGEKHASELQNRSFFAAC